ncbi:hypothetical protein QF037_006391 [Streptomyces canus]|nr:hypothetical protein [Streptomyces canus]
MSPRHSPTTPRRGRGAAEVHRGAEPLVYGDGADATAPEEGACVPAAAAQSLPPDPGTTPAPLVAPVLLLMEDGRTGLLGRLFPSQSAETGVTTPADLHREGVRMADREGRCWSSVPPAGKVARPHSACSSVVGRSEPWHASGSLSVRAMRAAGAGLVVGDPADPTSLLDAADRGTRHRRVRRRDRGRTGPSTSSAGPSRSPSGPQASAIAGSGAVDLVPADALGQREGRLVQTIDRPPRHACARPRGRRGAAVVAVGNHHRLRVGCVPVVGGTDEAGRTREPFPRGVAQTSAMPPPGPSATRRTAGRQMLSR